MDEQGEGLTLKKWDQWRRQWHGEDWPDDPEADERIDWTDESGPIVRWSPEATLLASRYPFPQDTINLVLAWSSDPKRIKLILDIMLATGIGPHEVRAMMEALADTPASTHPPQPGPTPYVPKHPRSMRWP